MDITNDKLADIVLDAIYTHKTVIELAEAHDVDARELERLHNGDTWNTLRTLALGEIIRCRVNKREEAKTPAKAAGSAKTPRQQRSTGEDGAT